MTSVAETVAFVVHAVKQFSFGVERLSGIADDYADGTPPKAFYLSALYNYVAVFYLLDKQKDKPMGGAFYPALERHGFQDLLDPIQALLSQPMGTTTFGEVVRIVRNKVVVHSTYRDADLDDLYGQVDMRHPANQTRLQQLLVALHAETRELALRLVQQAGLRPEDFGIHDRSRPPVATDPSEAAFVGALFGEDELGVVVRAHIHIEAKLLELLELVVGG